MKLLRSVKLFFYNSDKVLIMPSHLRTVTVDTLNLDYTEIIYHFPDGFLPKCIFHQLLAVVLRLCRVGQFEVIE